MVHVNEWLPELSITFSAVPTPVFSLVLAGCFFGPPRPIRTADRPGRNRMLCPLSYGRVGKSITARCQNRVIRIDPVGDRHGAVVLVQRVATIENIMFVCPLHVPYRFHHLGNDLEPIVRIERTTGCLRGSCSTI